MIWAFRPTFFFSNQIREFWPILSDQEESCHTITVELPSSSVYIFPAAENGNPLSLWRQQSYRG